MELQVCRYRVVGVMMSWLVPLLGTPTCITICRVFRETIHPIIYHPLSIQSSIIHHPFKSIIIHHPSSIIHHPSHIFLSLSIIHPIHSNQGEILAASAPQSPDITRYQAPLRRDTERGPRPSKPERCVYVARSDRMKAGGDEARC